MNREYIGIDPGVNTGVAVVRDGKLVECHTMPIHKALDFVKRRWEATSSSASPVRFMVIFEDARQRKWFEPEQSASEYKGKLMGAGSVKRDSKIWEDFLSDLKCPFQMHRPEAHCTKWDVAYWQKVTGYTGRTSEHARDASLLVLGK